MNIDWNIVIVGICVGLLILNLILLAIIGLMEIQKREHDRKKRNLEKLEK